MRHTSQLALLLFLATAPACRSYYASIGEHMDPTVVLNTGESSELGVSTKYGIVFLGHGQRSGEVNFTAWFQDGPSVETGIIEPLGSDLFLTHAEIQLPETTLTFQRPSPGTAVEVRGRRDGKLFQLAAEIAEDASVDGLLLKSSPGLEALGQAQIGAGIYLKVGSQWRLMGLLAGRMEIRGETQTRAYYTMAGPSRLWRLVSAARDLDQPKQLPKRGDILPE